MFLYKTLINFYLQYQTKYDSIVYTIKFDLRIFFSAIICILFSKKWYRIMQFSSLFMKTRLKSFEFKPLDMDHKHISYSLPPLIIVEIFGRKLAFFDDFFSGKWVSFLFSEYTDKIIYNTLLLNKFSWLSTLNQINGHNFNVIFLPPKKVKISLVSLNMQQELYR